MTSPMATTDATESAAAPLFLLGALVVENRRILLGLSFLGAIVALGTITVIGPRYSATASFVPQAAGEVDLSSLAGLAGQFGIPIRGAPSAQSPDFYAALVTSPAILDPIARGSYGRTPASRGEESLASLFNVSETDSVRRHEKVVEELQESIGASVNRRTGVISLRVRTPWPAVSHRIAGNVLAELNNFNLSTRQSQARAERMFAERRAAEAREALRQAEDALRDFSMRNRVQESPSLALESERLGRVVALRQQLLTSIEQSLEAARLREVQDTPVLTVLQAPMVRSVPDPRGRVRWTVLGGIFGLLLAAFVVPTRLLWRASRSDQSAQARRLRQALASMPPRGPSHRAEQASE